VIDEDGFGARGGGIEAGEVIDLVELEARDRPQCQGGLPFVAGAEEGFDLRRHIVIDASAF